MSRILDYILTLPQYLLPHHHLTGLVYRITRIESTWFKNLFIRVFIRVFNVDMSIARRENATEYASFNDFFTRSLKQGARPHSQDTKHILCPVDGTISQLGNIEDGEIIQAKGKTYSLSSLVASDKELANRFHGGQFATLYLSPRDYHRIHMPVGGRLQQTIFVPGKLFAVNNPAVRTVDSVFARNERFISVFDTPHGMMAQIMVGALFVGSMETVWAGQITPTKDRRVNSKQYSEQENITLKQCDEFGRFNMGSTVILLFEKDRIQWLEELNSGDKVIVGQLIANKR